MASGSGWKSSYNKSAKSRRRRYEASKYVLNKKNWTKRGKKYRDTAALPF